MYDVIPAQAGIHACQPVRTVASSALETAKSEISDGWTPAFAGVTNVKGR
jgi:hypothetical protein